MCATVFDSGDDAGDAPYLQWLLDHPTGPVLNSRRRPDPTYMIRPCAIPLFDHRYLDHRPHCLPEVRPASDRPGPIERYGLMGSINHRIGRSAQWLER
jgi:hypothetical protein